MDRRHFLKCAVAATAIAGSAFAAYELQSTLPKPTETTESASTSSQTLPVTSVQSVTPSLNALFGCRTTDRTLKYIVPHSGEKIQFVNETEISPTELPTNYEWSVDGTIRARTRDYSSVLSETRTTGVAHTVGLRASSGPATSLAEENIDVDPQDSVDYAEQRLDVPIKGITFLVGKHYRTVSGGIGTYQPLRGTLEIREQMKVIRNELGCNAVEIYGDYEEMMVESAKAAMDEGFDVILLAPRYCTIDGITNITVEESVARSIEFAKAAEELRSTCDRVHLQVSNELSLEASGIRDGPTYIDRQKQIGTQWRSQVIFERLNRYLKEMVEGVRGHFQGKITYGKLGGGDNGGGAENVDWKGIGFDIVGSHEYWSKRFWSREDMLRTLIDLKEYGKPVWITEFGCCSYHGASLYGGSGGQYGADAQYDEEEQAESIRDSIDLHQQTKIDGMFLHTFSNGYSASSNWNYGIVRGHGERMPLRRKKGFYAYKSYRTP